FFICNASATVTNGVSSAWRSRSSSSESRTGISIQVASASSSASGGGVNGSIKSPSLNSSAESSYPPEDQQPVRARVAAEKQIIASQQNRRRAMISRYLLPRGGTGVARRPEAGERR